MIRGLSGAISGKRKFFPTQITGLSSWFDASDLSTLFQNSGLTTSVTSDSDPIGGWKDKSGNGRDFTQGTSGARPLFKSSILNNQPALRFDGSDDTLVGASTTSVLPLSAGTFIAVCSVTPNTNGIPQYLRSSIFADNGGGYLGLHFGTDLSMSAFNFQGTSVFASRSFTSTTPMIVIWRLGGGNISVALNDTSFTNTASGATSAHSDNIALARNYNGSSFLPCDISEIITYGVSVSDSELATLVSSLKEKWGIA